MRRSRLRMSRTAPIIQARSMKCEWSPSRRHRSEPGEVLREARLDAAAGRSRLALIKHLWFHKNAVKLDRSLSAVRRSHALSAWRDLATKYRPALRALVKARNEAERVVWRQRDPWPAFHDLTSINEYLGEVKRTVSLFRALHKRSPRRAKRVYLGAEEALFQAGEFRLCNDYLEPLDRFNTIRRNYRVNLRLGACSTIATGRLEALFGSGSVTPQSRIHGNMLNRRSSPASKNCVQLGMRQ